MPKKRVLDYVHILKGFYAAGRKKQWSKSSYIFRGQLVSANLRCLKKEGKVMQKLNELQPGQSAIIADVRGDTRFLTRVISIGLTVGSRIEVLRNEKKMPLLLYGRDSMVALNRDESGNILVEVSV